MAKGIPGEISRDVSLLDIIVSGVSSWVISKLLDFTWRRVKARKLLKNIGPIGAERIGEAMLRFCAALLDVPDTLVNASLYRNADKTWILRFSRCNRVLREILEYSVRNS